MVDESDVGKDDDADGNNNDNKGEAAVEMTNSQARVEEVILVNPNAFDVALEEDGGGTGSEGGGHGRKRGRYGDRQTGCGNGKTLHCTYIILSNTLVFRGNFRVVWPNNGDNNNKSTIDRNDCAKTIFGSGIAGLVSSATRPADRRTQQRVGGAAPTAPGQARRIRAQPEPRADRASLYHL